MLGLATGENAARAAAPKFSGISGLAENQDEARLAYKGRPASPQKPPAPPPKQTPSPGTPKPQEPKPPGPQKGGR
jgi:hypothetical protein